MTLSTRERLLDAAVDLLLEDAGSGFTTGRLAARAGIVQSAFYNHFASVAEAQDAALDELRTLLAASIERIQREVAVPGTTTASDVERILLGVLEQASDRPKLFRLLVHRSHSPAVADVVDRLLEQLRRAIVVAILDPESALSHMDPRDAEIVAGLMVGHTLIVLISALDGVDPARLATTTGTFTSAGLYAVADRRDRVNPAAD